MSKYLKPLFTFISLNIVLLVAWLFMPAIGSAGAKLAADTVETGAFIWGWAWVANSVKLIVFLVFELLILYAVARVFLATRSR